MSRVIQKSKQVNPIRRCSRTDFPELSQTTVVALVPKVGPVRNHGIAISAKPIGVRHTAMAGCQGSLAVTSRKLARCAAPIRIRRYRRLLWRSLVRGAGPGAQHFLAGGRKVHFPFSGRSVELCPMHLVHHRDDATPTAKPIGIR